MIWDKDFECMDKEQREQLQLERLQSTLFRVFKSVPLYKKTFLERQFDPEAVKSLEDIRDLPFTTKTDVRDNYPYGLFAVPLREVVRLQSSSGTTGKPTVVGYTQNDIKKWSDLVARILTAGGVSKDDVVQICLNYGLFTGGFGFHYGAETIGASVIPSSSGGTRKQTMIMQDYRTTTLVSTPSYALYIADTLEDQKIPINSLSLKWGLFGAESWSDAMRQEIQERLNVKATDNYGISEVMGPGIAGECLEQNGLHINEDHFFCEIIHPETGDPLPDGEVGELVITTLTKEAFPVIRYRTGDRTCILSGECPCGRTTRRIHRILGRTDDMIIIRGINVFPSQIGPILYQIEGAKTNYQVVLERVDALDKATLLVEVHESILSDRIGEAQSLVSTIEKKVSSEMGIHFDIKLVEPSSLENDQGKSWKVIDKREL